MIYVKNKTYKKLMLIFPLNNLPLAFESTPCGGKKHIKNKQVKSFVNYLRSKIKYEMDKSVFHM